MIIIIEMKNINFNENNILNEKKNNLNENDN